MSRALLGLTSPSSVLDRGSPRGRRHVEGGAQFLRQRAFARPCDGEKLGRVGSLIWARILFWPSRTEIMAVLSALRQHLPWNSLIPWASPAPRRLVPIGGQRRPSCRAARKSPSADQRGSGSGAAKEGRSKPRYNRAKGEHQWTR